MAAVRPLVVPVDPEHKQILQLLAEQDNTSAERLAGDVIAHWVNVRGKPALLRHLAGTSEKHAAPRPRKQLAGQMTVDDALAG